MYKKIGKNGLLALGLFLIVLVFSGCSGKENAEKNVSLPPTQETTQQTEQVISTQEQFETNIEQEVKNPIVEVKKETKTEKIPFQTIKKDDDTLEVGKTKIIQSGVDGTKEFVYEVTYTDEIETKRELISEETKKEAVDKIVASGTKKITSTSSSSLAVSCGEDYYKNVDGNCVHRPSSEPAGASAKCKDGTYSYSQHRSGTCSSHGGVAEWL